MQVLHVGREKFEVVTNTNPSDFRFRFSGKDFTIPGNESVQIPTWLADHLLGEKEALDGDVRERQTEQRRLIDRFGIDENGKRILSTRFLQRKPELADDDMISVVTPVEREYIESLGGQPLPSGDIAEVKIAPRRGRPPKAFRDKDK